MADRKEYIERRALLEYLGADLEEDLQPEVVMEFVESIPAANVVEVVRCRECRKRGRDECPCHVKGELADEELLKDLDDDYCSYGERKDGAE